MDKLDEASARAYEQMPYGANAHPNAHPGRFAVLARLHGIDAPPLDGARVLELGCASGAHIAACAVAFPKASFVGVDRTVKQIERGREMLAGAGLTNVDLRAMDIMDVGTTLGTFDYIIVHGILSWVPENVQDEILRICTRSLAPRGIAYVSFNAYPGWHTRGIVRDALFFHLRGVEDAQARVTGARAFLEWWKTRLVESGAYGTGIIRELESIEKAPDHYFVHDHLGIVNLPLHFRTFVERAQATGLTYICESEPRSSALHGHLAAAREARAAAPDDRIAAEQYFDFLTNSSFRR
ncbi:MAG TPA: class I SAM-dependent methyltransferase, partial [Labilithrix sp.]